MAQPQAHKVLVDTLQGMINAILIETGKALRPVDKEGGKTMASSNMRLSLLIPASIENFHQALDELETDIVRAKSVLGRDLEVLRSKRIAAEAPPPVPVVEKSPAPDPASPAPIALQEDINIPIKEENVQGNTSVPTNEKEVAKQTQIKNSPNPTIPKDEMKEIISPPSSNENKLQGIGLGINTTIPDAPEVVAADGPDSSVDSLFNMPDSAAQDDSTALSFDNMDFSVPDSNTNTSTNTQTQRTQNTGFDLSTLGNTSQDFMTDLQPSNDTTGSMNNANNTTNTDDTTNKGDVSTEDFFNMTAGSTNNNNNDNLTNNNMDLDMDLGNMVGAEESVFDDMFFGGDDDGNLGGDMGEMEHGQFDNAFFGIE